MESRTMSAPQGMAMADVAEETPYSEDAVTEEATAASCCTAEAPAGSSTPPESDPNPEPDDPGASSPPPSALPSYLSNYTVSPGATSPDSSSPSLSGDLSSTSTSAASTPRESLPRPLPPPAANGTPPSSGGGKAPQRHSPSPSRRPPRHGRRPTPVATTSMGHSCSAESSPLPGSSPEKLRRDSLLQPGLLNPLAQTAPPGITASRSLRDIGTLSEHHQEGGQQQQQQLLRRGPPSVDALLSAIDELEDAHQQAEEARAQTEPPESGRRPPVEQRSSSHTGEVSSHEAAQPPAPPDAPLTEPPPTKLKERRNTDHGIDGAAPQSAAAAVGGGTSKHPPPQPSPSSSGLSPRGGLPGARAGLWNVDMSSPSATATTTPTKPILPQVTSKAESPSLDRSTSSVHGPALTPAKMPSLWEYLAGEAQPGPSVAYADPVWGATDRDVMYNSLISVPYQLERLMLFGLAVCMDPFMSVFTTVPLRALKAVWDLCQRLLLRFRAASGSSASGPLMRGDQLYDVLYLIIFAIAAWVVNTLNAGVIYFWMKDLSQEFVKLSVIFTAMEICDKILTSFGVSALHALSCSCTQFASDSGFGALRVASDFFLAAAITTAHAVALMSEAIAFSVAMNSRRTTLLALVISFNFNEVKSTVFKKFDPYKLTPIIFQDIVERFHMVMLMLFVTIEEMDASESWGSVNWQLMLQVGVILASEVVADIAKHAVVGKFNVIRPGVYREYMRDLCEATAKSQSNTLFKVVQMEPLGTAAIFSRMILSFLSYLLAPLEGKPVMEQIPALTAVILTYGAICLLKLAWGFLLRWAAASYLVYYEDNYGKTRGGHGAPHHGKAKAGASPGSKEPATGGGGNKKDN